MSIARTAQQTGSFRELTAATPNTTFDPSFRIDITVGSNAYQAQRIGENNPASGSSIMTISQVALFIPAALVVALSPGANNLLAFANGSRQGAILATIALLCRCLAFVLMIAMVIVGLGALLEASELAFQIVKWVSVAYLAYLGVKMFHDRDMHQDKEVTASMSGRQLAKREFIVAMSNPKAVLLFTAFVPQFIETSNGSSFTAQLMILGLIYIVIEFFAAIVWAVSGAAVRSLKPSARKLILINKFTGALMLGAAAMLATTKRV